MLKQNGNCKQDRIQSVSPYSRTVNYRFRLQNMTNQAIPHVRFISYAPVPLTCRQKCVDVQSSHDFTLNVDDDGNQLVEFVFDQLPPYGAKIISIHANIEGYAVPKRNDRREQILSQASNREKPFLSLAKELSSDTPRQTAENIYRWIATNIRYSGYSREAKGAVYALSRRAGDCTEFADLFVALSRAAGLAARRVSGYLAPEGGVLKPAAYHDWAEFYDNGVWRIADAQQKHFDTHYTDYIAMCVGRPEPATGGGRRFHHFFVEGNGIKATME